MKTARRLSAIAFLYLSVITEMASVNSVAWMIAYFLRPEDAENYYVLVVFLMVLWIVILLCAFWGTLKAFGQNLPIAGNPRMDKFIFGGALVACHLFGCYSFHTSLLAGFLMTAILYVVISTSYLFFGRAFAWLIGIVSFIVLIEIFPKWWTKDEVMLATLYTGYMTLALGGSWWNFKQIGNSPYFNKYPKSNIARLGLSLYFFEVFTLLLGNILNWSTVSNIIQKNGEIIESSEFENQKLNGFIDDEEKKNDIPKNVS